jgi:hypothetical protein
MPRYLPTFIGQYARGQACSMQRRQYSTVSLYSKSIHTLLEFVCSCQDFRSSQVRVPTTEATRAFTVRSFSRCAEAAHCFALFEVSIEPAVLYTSQDAVIVFS